jgi:hypothetical protein
VLKRLQEVPDDALREARAEIVTTTIFAAMPFWFPIVGYIILVQPPALLDSVRNGELLIYAATLVGPLAYIITKRYGRYVAPKAEPGEPETPLSYPFPEGRTSVTFAMVICIISGVVITLQKIQTLPELKNIQLINTTGLAISSVILLVVATILLFCVSAYRNFIEMLAQDHSDKINRSQQHQEDAMAAEWRARKEQQ